jgi:acyl-CoA synthetase (NDP forming)
MTAAVVTTTAGGATMVVDPLSVRGIEVQRPSDMTLSAIKERTGIEVTPARLIDLTLAGAQYDVMKGALDVLTSAPEFDLVIVVVGSSARFYPHLAVKPIIDSASAQKPLAVFLVPEAPDALAQLAAAGVPSFHTPEACADAVAAALKRRAGSLRAAGPSRCIARNLCRPRRHHRQGAAPAFRLSAGREGAVRGHRAQIRCRWGGAQRE